MMELYLVAAIGTAVFLGTMWWINLHTQKYNCSGAKGKVVVVTGGLSGLGHQIAELYRVRGAHVAVLDIKDEDYFENSLLPGVTRYYKCDVSNRGEVEVTVNRVETDVSIQTELPPTANSEQLGIPDILINCAATQINKRPFHDLPSDSFAKTININLLGPVNLVRAILPRLIQKRKPASIVNISSVVAHLYPAGLSDYTCSKAGLSALHHCLEAEARCLGYSQRINFFLVEIGQMQTPLFDWIKPPNPSLAPILEPSYVAQKIFSALDSGGPRVIRLPKYASWVCGFDILPVRVQRHFRFLMGIDEALANH